MSDPIQGAIVTAAATARRRVEEHFMALHAISPDDAIEYVPPRPIERKQFDRLRKLDIIRTAVPGLYWLDLTRLDATEEARRRRHVPVVIAATVVIALLLTLLYQG